MTRSETSPVLHHGRRSLIKVGRYEILKVLGKGNFARVEEAVHTTLKIKVAVKVIDTGLIREDYVIKNLTREAKLLSKLRHPSIVRLYETIQCGPIYYLVIELATGGDLYTHIKNQPLARLDEKTAKGYGRQLVAALEHMHSRGIVHRDLKMENIMLKDARKEQIKIVDFGLSNIYTGDNPLETHCGSPEYAAPELFVVGKRYGPEVDLWSLGVVFYAMATGRLPFQSSRDNQTSSEERRRKLLAQINRGLTAAQKKSIAAMSSEYRNLVNRLLMPSPHKRINVRELSFHPWISNRQRNTTKMSQSDLLALEHDAIIDEIAEATRTERAIIEREILQSKYGEMGGMYNIKAHAIRQGGSFHAFRARSWTTTSHSSRRQSPGQNHHSAATPRTGYQPRSSLGTMQTNAVRNQPNISSTMQRRAMIFRRSVPAKPASSVSGDSRGGTWTPKETRATNSCSYTNQRTSTCPVHNYNQSKPTPGSPHRAKWDDNSQQIHANVIIRASHKSSKSFAERPVTLQPPTRIASREIRTSQFVRPAYSRPEVILRRKPVERWITEKLNNSEKRDRSLFQSDRYHVSNSSFQDVEARRDPRNNNRTSISRDIRSDQPGAMGQGDRVTEGFLSSPSTLRSDLRNTRLILSNGNRMVDKNPRGSRPTNAAHEESRFSTIDAEPTSGETIRPSNKLRWLDENSSRRSNAFTDRYKSWGTDCSRKVIVIEKDLRGRYHNFLKGILRDSPV